MAAGLSSYPLVYKPLDANTPFEPGNRLVVVINDDFLRRTDSGPALDRAWGMPRDVGCLTLRRLGRNRCVRILTTRPSSDQMLLVDSRPRESPGGRFAAR